MNFDSRLNKILLSASAAGISFLFGLYFLGIGLLGYTLWAAIFYQEGESQ